MDNFPLHSPWNNTAGSDPSADFPTLVFREYRHDNAISASEKDDSNTPYTFLDRFLDIQKCLDFVNVGIAWSSVIVQETALGWIDILCDDERFRDINVVFVIPKTGLFSNLLAFLLAYGADDNLLRRAIRAGADVDRTIHLMSRWTPDIMEEFGGENLAHTWRKLFRLKSLQSLEKRTSPQPSIPSLPTNL